MIRAAFANSCVLLAFLFTVHGSFAERCAEQPDKPGITAFCGVTAPEDLVLVDDRYLIMSSFAPAPHLFGFDTRDGWLGPLVTTIDLNPDARWGDEGCPAPAAMVTHGLDLSRRSNGEWQLLAVNHGNRESIEFFAVVPRPNEPPELHWRGCVLAPDEAQFNDVAALPDGGFVATDPITASWHLLRMFAGELGIDSGSVYRWRPGSGFEVVPGTAGAYPNGITLSADGESFYLNVYQDGEVREHDLESGRLLRSIAVQQPDNSTLTADGTLLVASHDASIFTMLAALMSPPDERTAIAYSIVAIDTESFTSSERFSTDGSELGAGTVAVAHGDDLYIGSFRGDRLIRVSVPPAPPAN